MSPKSKPAGKKAAAKKPARRADGGKAVVKTRPTQGPERTASSRKRPTPKKRPAAKPAPVKKKRVPKAPARKPTPKTKAKAKAKTPQAKAPPAKARPARSRPKGPAKAPAAKAPAVKTPVPQAPAPRAQPKPAQSTPAKAAGPKAPSKRGPGKASSPEAPPEPSVHDEPGAALLRREPPPRMPLPPSPRAGRLTGPPPPGPRPVLRPGAPPEPLWDAIALPDEKTQLRRYCHSAQMPSPMGGFLEPLRVRTNDDGSGTAIFECSASSLRFALTIPAATRREKKRVKDHQDAGEDPNCPRHDPLQRLNRVGPHLVCLLCGVRYGKV